MLGLRLKDMKKSFKTNVLSKVKAGARGYGLFTFRKRLDQSIFFFATHSRWKEILSKTIRRRLWCSFGLCTETKWISFIEPHNHVLCCSGKALDSLILRCWNDPHKDESLSIFFSEDFFLCNWNKSTQYPSQSRYADTTYRGLMVKTCLVYLPLNNLMFEMKPEQRRIRLIVLN